ncbi:hypothetical protein SOVF_207260 [Spinacia oleracea]|nr:hypothetical protein SOVF_207260 [Spinacia oleracea]
MKKKLESLGETVTPSLLYTNGNLTRKPIHSFYSPLTGNSDLKSIPELRYKSVLGSSYGWLILFDSTQIKNNFSLFNPVTLNTINLPPLDLPPLLAEPEQLKNVKIGLNSSPDSDSDSDSDDCLLIICYNGVGRMLSCRPGQPNCNWVIQNLEIEDLLLEVIEIFTLSRVMYVYAKGLMGRRAPSFYQVSPYSTNTKIKPCNIHLPDYDIPGPAAATVVEHLVESCNCLYYVFISKDTGLHMEFKAIKVYKLNFDDNLWTEINSLNDRAFFLGRNCNSTWCWGTTDTDTDTDTDDYKSQSQGDIKRNCIYFYLPPTLDEPQVFPLYSYNLHDQSLTALCPCSNLVYPSSCPVWVDTTDPRLSVKEGFENADCITHGELQNPTECCELGLSQGNRFSELPLDLVVLISKSMHLFEYWNFRACCKTYRSLCPAPQWRTNNAFPLFVFFKNRNNLCEMIDPSRHDSRSCPYSSDSLNLQFCNYGWLLTFVGKRSMLRAFNLFTGERKDYQCFRHQSRMTSIAFSTNPTSSECLTVGIYAPGDGTVTIWYLQHADPDTKWIKTWHHIENIKFHGGACSPIFLAGAFYFLDVKGYLGVSQLVDGKASLKIYDKPPIVEQIFSIHLLECAGEVYSAFVMNNSIQVFRFDESIKSWVQVNRLENHCFFISRASSFSTFTSNSATGSNASAGAAKEEEKKEEEESEDNDYVVSKTGESVTTLQKLLQLYLWHGGEIMDIRKVLCSCALQTHSA